MGYSTNDMAKYYYYLKPMIPRRLQLVIRKWVAVRKRQACRDVWPIDRKAGTPPRGWRGWPGGKRFAVVLTHDVDTQRGHDRCRNLIELERDAGFRSAFNFVAEGYTVSPELRKRLVSEGFEVGLHGLRHDRGLYSSKEEFDRQAIRINRYLKEWGARGFRSPSMYHNLPWMHGLDISYDASTFDTDPFEPQPDAAGTIFPFLVPGGGKGKGYIELPYTLPQDFTLFILFRERDIDIWKHKVDWIAEQGGMLLLNTHPDYMRFDGGNSTYEEYPARLYRQLLEYVERQYAGSYWHILPREIAEFWMKEARHVSTAGSMPIDQKNQYCSGVLPAWEG